METTFARENHSTRRSGGSRAARNKRRGVALAPRESRRLIQLCVCAALFLAVFLGRGILPEKLDTVRQDLLNVVRGDTDFRAAFASLGQSISEGEPVVETLGTLWGDVFSVGRQQVVEVGHFTPEQVPTYYAERDFLASNPDARSVLARRFGITVPVEETVAQRSPIPVATSEPAVTPTPEGTLPAQPKPVYTGAAMPDGATMEQVELGLEATTAPVMAAVSSTYGWREHPIAGGEKFHSGLDLAANYGSDIGAFADGTVDYIGESPAYGQYLQLRHANGVTSFYAHCSKLCVQKGQQVTAGEKVAEVGNTGNVTGTHLHFELKQDGEFVNPSYYIKTVS